MGGDYFLLVLGVIWIIFASVQDIRKREVANWLNFSLIAFALAYKAFESVNTGSWNIFLLGIAGFAIFFVFGNLLYYARAFGGGDAKLLFGMGALLPYTNFYGLFFLSGFFIFILFFVGAIYTLIYSFFIMIKRKEKFVKEFKNYLGSKVFIAAGVAAAVVFFFGATLFESYFFGAMGAIFVLFILFLYIYLKSVDKCMAVLVNPGKLTEGDWIVGDIRIGREWIRKNVHGLSIEDIMKLKRARKKVLIKEGVPFVPSFLIAFLIMVFFYLVLGSGFLRFLAFLF